MEVQDIFEDIVDSDPAADQDPHAVCIRKLDNHFRAEENMPFERHVFRQLAPTEGEPVDKFVVRLRQQARHCNFGDSLDDDLRDQLIEKLPDMELKKKLLETRNITLLQVLEKARASKAAGQQMKHMAGGMDVNAVTKKENKAYDHSGKTCFSCGKKAISHGISAVRPKGGNVRNARDAAILLRVAKLTVALHLKRRECLIQRKPLTTKEVRQTNQSSGRF